MRQKLTAIFSLLVFFSFGQNKSNSKIGQYSWNEAVLIQPCKIDGTNESITVRGVATRAPEIKTEAGQDFIVLKLIDDGATAIIQILDYTKSNKKTTKKSTGKSFKATPNFLTYNFKGTQADYDNLQPEAVNSRNYGDKQAYFKVSVTLLDEYAESNSKIKGALAAGVINFPFKYRPQKGNADFSGAFNFGAGIGYKFPHKVGSKFTFSLISGYSISNVVLDSANSDRNQGKLSSTNNFTAFSFSLGGLFEYQRIQAGIFIGWDRISKLNQKEYGWQYQGKPWISVGFGIAIFSGQEEKSEKNSSSQSK